MRVEDEPSSEWQPDPHRRQAAYLYGLIVTGAVLATAPDDFRLTRVAALLLVTLGIYWAAETYVHVLAARTLLLRRLTGGERRAIAADGWPLVAASAVPLALLIVEALVGIDTKIALDLTLAVNAGLLFAVGWRMSRDSGLTGVRLLASAAAAGLLGALMIVLKTSLH